MEITHLLLLIGILLAPLSSIADDLLHRASELIKRDETQQALELLTDAANAGDPAGAYGLGVLYFQGTGVERDIEASSDYFQKAAKQGHVLAQYNLGNAYLHGRGVTKDLSQAEHWWRQASMAGYVRAQYNLGLLLQENAEAIEFREEGIAWLHAAAERGFPKAVEKLEGLNESLTLKYGENDYAKAILRSEARLLTLPPDGYAIQLFSGRLASSAENFIQQYNLQDRALRFRFPRKGELWTGVLYGLYKKRGEARQTIAELKATLKDAGPWLRPMSEIQALIRAAWRDGGAPDAVAAE